MLLLCLTFPDDQQKTYYSVPYPESKIFSGLHNSTLHYDQIKQENTLFAKFLNRLIQGDIWSEYMIKDLTGEFNAICSVRIE